MLQFIPKLKGRNVKKSQTAHKLEGYEDQVNNILLDNIKFRGRYNHKYDFVVIYLISCIGIGNVVNFPRLAYFHGGGTFIVMYFFMSIGFSIPIFLIESGLSQFYSLSELDVFRVIPYFRGLGWSIIVLSLVLYVPYSVKIEWCLHYLIYTVPYIRHSWTRCGRDIPGITCVETLNRSLTNKSDNELHPSLIFFELDVKGSRRFNDGIPYTFENSLGGINWFQFFLIIAVWIFVSIFTALISNLYTKFLYVIFVLSSAILLLLTIHSLFQSGSLKGISTYFDPNLDNLLTYESFKDIISQMLFSICITKGIITFACINTFKYDLLMASYLIAFGDFMFSFLSGIFIFATMGFLSQKLKVDIRDLFSDNVDLIFVNFFDAQALLSERDVFSFICVLMIIMMSIGSIGVTSGAFVIALVDSFPKTIDKTAFIKTLIGIGICTILCGMSLFFSLNGGCLYMDIFDRKLNDFSSPILMLAEIVMIHFFYGEKRLRLEIKMMIGYSYNIFWKYLAVSFVPISIIYLLSYTIYNDVTLVIPTWAIMSSYVITIVVMSPVVIYFLSHLIQNVRTYKSCSALMVGLKTPKIYGPYYKCNWLLSKYYQKKLIELKSDPEFIETIRETEDLELVIQTLRTSRAEFREKEKQYNLKMLRAKFMNSGQTDIQS